MLPQNSDVLLVLLAGGLVLDPIIFVFDLHYPIRGALLELLYVSTGHPSINL